MISVIGNGGYAKVVLVRNNIDSKVYAMKMLKKKMIGIIFLIEQKNQVAHIITERNVMASFHHTFIIKMHECF